MKLFLCSQAKNPKSIERLKKFDTGISNRKCLYIPTAANGEMWGLWKDGDSLKVAKSLIKNIQILELEYYNKYDINKICSNIDVIWIAGGMVGYLIYWLKRTGFDEKIKELTNRNTLYIGSSAGCWLCSKNQNVAEWFIGEEELNASSYKGLGLIDFEIYPHYEDKLYQKIKSHWKKGDGKLYLLKDGEVITVVDNKITVLGETRIIDK